jgi:hypothetical protein
MWSKSVFLPARISHSHPANRLLTGFPFFDDLSPFKNGREGSLKISCPEQASPFRVLPPDCHLPAHVTSRSPLVETASRSLPSPRAASVCPSCSTLVMPELRMNISCVCFPHLTCRDLLQQCYCNLFLCHGRPVLYDIIPHLSLLGETPVKHRLSPAEFKTQVQVSC